MQLLVENNMSLGLQEQHCRIRLQEWCKQCSFANPLLLLLVLPTPLVSLGWLAHLIGRILIDEHGAGLCWFEHRPPCAFVSSPASGKEVVPLESLIQATASGEQAMEFTVGV